MLLGCVTKPSPALTALPPSPLPPPVLQVVPSSSSQPAGLLLGLVCTGGALAVLDLVVAEVGR